MIIQHHDSVVTSSDLGLALHCQYDLGNKTISNGLDLEVNGEIESALVENGKVESPNVVMSVTARGGDPVERAQVSQETSYVTTGLLQFLLFYSVSYAHIHMS